MEVLITYSPFPWPSFPNGLRLYAACLALLLVKVGAKADAPKGSKV